MGKKLTPAQRAALEIIRDHQPDGPAEFTLLYTVERKLPPNLEAAICDRVLDALFAKKLIHDFHEEGGYRLCEAGRAALEA